MRNVLRIVDEDGDVRILIRHGDHDQSDHGAWASAGGSGRSSVRGEKAHAAALPSQPLSPEAQDAVEWYGVNSASVVNGMLRQSGGEIDDRNPIGARVTRGMDEAMAGQSLAEDISVERGVEDMRYTLGGREPAVGLTYVDHGFVSTSTSGAHWQHDSKGSAVLTIKAPEGTRALSMPDASKILDPGEVVLDRGLTYRMTSVEKDDNGAWKIDVEVVP